MLCAISLYSVTNLTSEGYRSIVHCLYFVLKFVIVLLVIHFKLMTNLRLFINYKKRGILLLFVISWCRWKNKFWVFSPPVHFTFCLSLFLWREIPAAIFFCISLSKEKKEVFLSKVTLIECVPFVYCKQRAVPIHHPDQNTRLVQKKTKLLL
jgi:hypothetical protein